MNKSTQQTEQKIPMMAAWKAHWTGYKQCKPTKKKRKYYTEGTIKYHAMELAILGHKLIKTKYVNYIPIFMELRG